MKKVYPKLSAICVFLTLFIRFSFAQTGSGWSSKFEAQKVFIENKGQFRLHETAGFDSKVQYAFDGNGQNIFYFTKSGLVFNLTEIKKNKDSKEKDEREMKERMKKGMTAEEHAQMEKEERRLNLKQDELRAQWVGANPNVQIIAEDRNESYFSYSFRNETGELVHANNISAFKKLIYKDIYPNIDVVYEMHPQEGIKYSLVVRPGGDISQVKLAYSKKTSLLGNGNIKIRSAFGDFTDHAPVTFYADDKTGVTSSYELHGNVVSFTVGNHDPARTLVIDPWIQTPSFNTQWHCIWECERDAAGNVYVIGGVMPMQLLKYNPVGTLQWTYSTPYDTTSWLGTFAVDNAGNSYVTCGSNAQIEKVNTSGTVMWSNSNPGGLFSSTEFWTISFNCDQTQLVIGGTGGPLLPPLPFIYNIDMTSGNVLNSVQVTGGALFPTQEVRAITACGNGNYYFLTHDSIGYIHQGLTSCLPPGSSYPFHVSNGYALGYKCENFRYNNTGIAAIKSFGGFVYTHRGNQLHKRNFSTGAIVATATIPGGGFSSNQVTCSGIDIDSCGNVYVGSVNQVVKFNSSLTQLGTFPTSFNVYDVAVTSTGALIAAGSTGNGNSGARTGYVQSFAANACANIAIVCCDASICPHASVCTTDAPFNLTSTTAGGVWSGTGITNTSTGTFSPAVSGVGTFTVYYTLPCGRDSTVITVNSCTATSVCKNSSGSFTITGGTAPYTWSVYDSTGQVCQGGIVLFGICTGTWVTTYGWTTFATGATATPPTTTDTIKVVDNAGTTITIYNQSTVAPCNACNMTVSAGAQRNVLCFGASTGAAHVTVTGGTAPFTYTWSGGVSTLDSAVNLPAGTYTVTVHDASTTCTGTASFTITQPAAALATTNTTLPASCGNNTGKIVINATGGTPGYTYSWTPNVSTTDSAVNLAAGNYTVVTKDANNCTVSNTINVASSAGVTAALLIKRDVNCFGASTGFGRITASGGVAPYTYTWSAPAVSTLDSANNLVAGNYSVTVKDANNCTGVVTFTISQPASALSATSTTQPAYCGNNTGKIHIIASGGTPGYTYQWQGGISTNDSAVGLASGPYGVTVTDSKGCTATLTPSVAAVAGGTVSLVSKKDVSCNGGTNGKIFVTTTGGVTPYTYTWSAPVVSTTDSAVNLAQGTYTVTVKDANNCSSTLSVTINQPVVISATTSTTQANCGASDGSATVSASGGTGTLTYQWTGGNTNATDPNLAAGTYTVTVTDANLCTAVATAAVSNIGGPTVTIANQVNESCNGASTGKIVLNVSGGATPYTYTWSPNVSTVDSAVNLAVGTYNVTVHDASSCIAVATATITQPQALSAVVLSTNASCGSSDGSAQITVIGGTSPYSYVWSVAQSTDSITAVAGGTYHVTVTDAQGCQLIDSVVVGTNNGPATPVITASGPLVFCQGGSVVLTSSAASGNTWSTSATTQSITVTSSGSFTVTQTVGGCTSPPSAPVVVTVNPIPAAPTITASGPLSFCPGGSVTLSSSASSGNLWSDNETTQSIVVNTAGTYTVTDTQAGCPSSPSAPVTVSIISAPQVTINASQPALCPGSGSVTLDATTASASAYLWNTTSTQPTITINTPGTYSVSVTVNGCSGSGSITINSEPLLGSLALVDSSICPGSLVTIDATTLNATSYVWSGGISSTAPVIMVDTEGVYTVVVSNSCGSINASTTITFKDCECKIVMPNAFTPNGDTKNEMFGPNFKCSNPKYLMMRIFNRWGEKVFETNDLYGQWDGKYKGTAQPPGVYVYYVEFVGLENNVERTFKLMGSITVIR